MTRRAIAAPRSHLAGIARAGLVALAVGSLTLPAIATAQSPVMAPPSAPVVAPPSPVPDASPAPAELRMTARPLLAGAARPGAWMAVRVHLENDGPAVSGELRLSGGQAGDSRYGVAVELPTGARQEHVLFAQPTWFGARLTVTLASGETELLSQPLAVRAVDAWTPTVVVVAERPEGFVSDLRAGITQPMYNPPVILTVDPSDLPPRVEAWSAIDRLVWQDVDSTRLDDAQRAALRTWLGAGGRLVVVGGSTGSTTLGGFGEGILPYRPTTTVDAAPADLAPLVDPLPEDATDVPAVAGPLDAGTVLARSGDEIIAAQRSVGQGSVVLVGIDPAAEWLHGTGAATALWRRLVPGTSGAVMNPLVLQDDSQVVAALGNLPAVDLPDIAVLFGLLALYITLIGPVNYLVLRRLDRREWAWVTMPALVAVFTAAAYGLGMTLKGTDVIINQVGIVRTAAGSDAGVGQVYVGVFSPTRATYDVRVDRAALLTNPTYLAQQGQSVPPLDVVTGETSRLRGYEVGFAVLRVFRAEAALPVPPLDADLSYRDGTLTGILTNRSDRPLSSVAVTWGGAAQVIPSLAPGESAPVTVRVTSVAFPGQLLSEKLFGLMDEDGIARETLTRRQVIDQITYYSDTLGGFGSVQQGPVVLAWASEPAIGVELGTPAKSVGETLLIAPAPVAISGPTVFPNALVGHAIVTSEANEAMDQGTSLSLSRGTMVVELRPMGFGGPFEASALSLLLTQGEVRSLSGKGPLVGPLPDTRQPSQDDPLGTAPVAEAGAAAVAPAADAKDPAAPVEGPGGGDPLFDGIPEVQLFDRAAGRWLEFPHPAAGREFRVIDPGRYVDETGAVLVRFVNRTGQGQTAYFSPLMRLEGVAG